VDQGNKGKNNRNKSWIGTKPKEGAKLQSTNTIKTTTTTRSSQARSKRPLRKIAEKKSGNQLKTRKEKKNKG